MTTFMVQFDLKPGHQGKMMDLFELRGPNKSPGVSFRDGWIGTRSNVIFVVCESADEELVKQACEVWSEYGDYQIHPVIHHEQY